MMLRWWDSMYPNKNIRPAKNRKELLEKIIEAFPELLKYKSLKISKKTTSEFNWFSHIILGTDHEGRRFFSDPEIALICSVDESLNQELVAKFSNTSTWEIWPKK